MNPVEDAAYLRLAVPDLQDYLLSKELFWPLPSTSSSLGVPGLNQMTLGGVVLSLARVTAAGNPVAEEYSQKINATRMRWRSTWSKKAAREFSARVRLWSSAMDDLFIQKTAIMSRFPAQVRIRTMLELLKTEMAPESPEELEWLAGLDQRLRGASRPGKFVWETELAAGFPETLYWFLFIQI
jgi:hypothetical protein